MTVDNRSITVSKPGRDTNGRFVAGGQAAKAAGRVSKAKRAAGSDGVVAYGGYIHSGEQNSRASGSQKWVEYANAFQRPPVAIAALLRSALLSGAKWSLVENEAGGADAKRGLEICDQGLLKAKLPKPWPMVVRKTAMHYFNGFSIHATAMGRRPDGMIVYTDIAHRPAHTIEKWLRTDDDRPFEEVEQRVNGKTHRIPLKECLYVVNDVLGDSPEGVGVLRLLLERIDRVSKYEELEGSEYFSSLGGLPIARVPLEEINAGLSGTDDEKAAKKAAKTRPIREVVENRIKTPERQSWLMLSSETYQGQDPNTISGIKKWDVEIVKADLQGVSELRRVITDEDLNAARILGVEFVFVGGGDSAGTYGMHESKVGMFAGQLQSTLDEIAECATSQLLRRLVAANGLDPDTATPRLVPEKITISSVLEAMQAMALMNQAGIHPKDPMRNVVRERLEMPPEPEGLYEQDAAAPRALVDEDDLDDDDDDPDPVEQPDDEDEEPKE